MILISSGSYIDILSKAIRFIFLVALSLISHIELFCLAAENLNSVKVSSVENVCVPLQ